MADEKENERTNMPQKYVEQIVGDNMKIINNFGLFLQNFSSSGDDFFNFIF